MEADDSDMARRVAHLGPKMSIGSVETMSQTCE